MNQIQNKSYYLANNIHVSNQSLIFNLYENNIFLQIFSSCIFTTHVYQQQKTKKA